MNPMFASFWPFDFSCSGFVFVLVVMLIWLSWSIGSAVEKVGEITKNVIENETVQEAGKGIFASWLDDLFNKK